MCNCDFTAPDLYRETLRKAKKQHKCCECGAIIRPGSIYADIFVVWDNEARGFKQCLGCDQIADRLVEENECGYAIGLLYEELIEGEYLAREDGQWTSRVDWLKVVNQKPLSCIAVGEKVDC